MNIISPPGAVATLADARVADGFDTPGLLGWLETAAHAEVDGLPFGVVTMAHDGTVEHYNVAEAALTGLTPERVVGRNFFTSVAPCTNNFMVAHRFDTEAEIDATIDYVFTFRLAPMKVPLRLMKRVGSQLMYLAVRKRD